MITKKIADNILNQLSTLDVLASEQERLKTETMDGKVLSKELVVFSINDPFYPVVIQKLMPNSKMCKIKCRHVRDRRKGYIGEGYNKELFSSQFNAFEAAIKKHDKIGKTLTCNINDAEKIIKQRKTQRLKIVDEMGKILNKENSIKHIIIND